MNAISRTAVFAFAATVAAASLPAFAQSAGGGQPPAPPQFAIDACKGKAAGAAVTFKSPEGKDCSGTCGMIGNTLAAIPDRKPGGGRPGEGAPASR